MIERILLVGILLYCLLATTTGQNKHQCRQKYEKVGCFHDRVVPDRPLTIQILNRMDKYSRKWDGQLMNWKHYEETLYKLACKCAELTLAKGYPYFGIQFYGECWTGPANETYTRDGPSKECVGGKFSTCNDKSSAECAGRCFSNYIYKVHKPIDGMWGKWTTWGACSGKCGDKGFQRRTRQCNNPAPAHGGKPCAIPTSNAQARTCVSKPCSEWASWGSWGQCTTSRQRACVIKGTNLPGKNCPGNKEQTKKCTGCAGNWAAWGKWSVCISKIPCAKGIKTRQRTCLPLGFKCAGSPSQSMSCTHQCFPNWTTWGPWGRCSAKCGGGARSRRRKCVAKGTSIEVQGCRGSSSEIGKCNLVGCPAWGPWGPWGVCQGRCGTGSRTRAAICVIKGTSTPTTGCPGRQPIQTGTCKLKGCPTWTPWGPWSPCTFMCTRIRSRKCVEAGTNKITTGCPGVATSTGPCATELCGDKCRNLKCLPTDFEGYICGRLTNTGRLIQYDNNCLFKQAQCRNKLLVRHNHGRCLTIGGPGGPGNPGGPNIPGPQL